MILVDDRSGSKHLVPAFEKHDVPCKLSRLDYADIAFTGKGENDEPQTVGVELKAVNEIVDDLIRPRFSGHQLPGLLRHYDWCWLVVEGPCRPNHVNGRLEVPRGKAWKSVKLGSRFVPYQTFWAHLHTLSIKMGLPVVRTYSKNETVWQLITLYRWWADRGWDGHQSHDRMWKRPIAKIEPSEPHSLVRRVAADLPAIGRKRSKAVAEHFPSVWSMVCATEDEWRGIEGIGKETAKRVVRELEGR